MLLLFIFEIIGTVAFAVSGALTGVKKRLDVFGVLFLSVTTAVGGGIFRDIMIGNTPPAALVKPIYFLISIGSAIITILLNKKVIRLKYILSISDAIGLGVFTAIGSSTALAQGMNKPFIILSMGLITGVGGGILRDVFVKDIPLIFRREIYAMASILGALVFYFAYNHLSYMSAMYLCFLATFMVRMISVRYNINLPRLKKDLVQQDGTAVIADQAS